MRLRTNWDNESIKRCGKIVFIFFFEKIIPNTMKIPISRLLKNEEKINKGTISNMAEQNRSEHNPCHSARQRLVITFQ